jgi:hypothetical protein
MYGNYAIVGENVMAPPPEGDPPASSGAMPEYVPAMQRVLDNPFLLLFLGVTIPTVFYLIWGIMELTQIPIAP